MNGFPMIRVFGGAGIYADEPISIGGARQRRLLALLAIRAGSVVTVDWLAEHIWDDDERPDAAEPALRTAVSRLRSAMPDPAGEWIVTEPSGYRLAAPDEAVEHLWFSALRAQARDARDRDDPTSAQALLDEALALYRGSPFGELEDFPWARIEIERLEAERLETLEERWETALALGRHTQIIGELSAFAAEHRSRDRAARQLALALHRSGRTAEALRELADYRQELAEASGIEPSAELEALEEAILTDDPSLQLSEGTPLRGYRLIEEIGSGAFSVVWRAVQPSVERDVAIKQIRSELASQPDFIRRFEAEARLVARIEHPHIVPLIDFWRDPDSAYLVMRWLRGGTLEQVLEGGPLGVAETVHMVHQVADALAAAHEQGVVHRDVKTANILFDESGNAFLSDFGVAIDAGEAGTADGTYSPGSPAYSSPEQIRREPLGPEADIFSLGVVVFECLAGGLPFSDSTSLEELVDRQLHTEFPALADVRADVPQSLSAAVERATAKDPKDRFGSVSEFVAAMASDLAELETVPVLTRDIANPYNGLHAFDTSDEDRFFGRERLVQELVERLAGSDAGARSVVVVGPSGSGKSSVVRAGLIPALRKGAVSGSDEWFVTTMVPGADPFDALADALRRIAVGPPDDLAVRLRGGADAMAEAIRGCVPAEDATVVVVIDQSEEIFTGASADDAELFLSALSGALDTSGSSLRLIATLRADYYHRPLEHPQFARVVKASAVEVTPLAGDELERAITQPARSVGIELEPGLAARIASDATGQRSPLPLLQYTLTELFDRRSGRTIASAAYDEIGGLSGALAARAEALHDAATPPERNEIRRLFGRMTNPTEEAADLRRRVPIADLGDDESTRAVLDRFGAARLVTFDRDVSTREPTVEVAHEALLREWPRLVGWLAEDREELRAADAIRLAATAWDGSGRADTDLYRGGRLESAVDLALDSPHRLRTVDTEFIDASRRAAEAARNEEQRRVRRLRRLVAGVAAALVVALIAGGVAVNQRNQAQAAVEDADLATIISRSAALTGENPEVAVLLALEAHRRDPKPETELVVLNALGSSAIPNRISSLPPLTAATDPCGVHSIAQDGMTQHGIVDGMLVTRDTTSGAVTERGPSPIECGRWIGDPGFDRRFAIEEGRMVSGTFDGPWDVSRELEHPTFLVSRSFKESGQLAFVAFPPTGPQVVLHDVTTLEPVPPISEGDEILAVGTNGDGSLLAMGWAIHNGPDGDGHTVIADAATGTELFHVNTDFPAREVAFDDATGHLIAALWDGTLVTIDLQAQEIVAEVETSATSDLWDLGVRSDGLVVAVTSGHIELLDRFSGPTGTEVELFNTDNAFIRSDDAVLLLSPDNEIDVVDLGGNALIEASWSVDPFANIAFGAGLASDSTMAGEARVRLTDLASGDQTEPPFILPDGSAYRPVVVWPYADAMWALGIGRDPVAITRWVDGALTHEVVIGLEGVSGNLSGDLAAMYGFTPDGSSEAKLISLDPADPRVLFTVDVEGAVRVHPTRDGGMHVLDNEANIRTFDSTGELVGELAAFPDKAEGIWVGDLAVDPVSGDLAIATAAGLLVVDIETEEVEMLTDVRNVSRTAFVRNGELLVILELDGTVRLWNLERGGSSGLVWDGTGSSRSDLPWYDEATDTVWVATSGLLLQVPLDPDRWLERACEVVGRNLTQEEWDRHIPGDGELQSACEVPDSER